MPEYKLSSIFACVLTKTDGGGEVDEGESGDGIDHMLGN